MRILRAFNALSYQNSTIETYLQYVSISTKARNYSILYVMVIFLICKIIKIKYMKLTENQKIYLVPSYWDSRNNNSPKEVTISKVGKKYFQLLEYPRNKYEIETMQEVNNTNYKGQCYLTLQEILDLREHSNLSKKIKDFFNGCGEINVSLIKLKQINQILFENN